MDAHTAKEDMQQDFVICSFAELTALPILPMRSTLIILPSVDFHWCYDNSAVFHHFQLSKLSWNNFNSGKAIHFPDMLWYSDVSHTSRTTLYKVTCLQRGDAGKFLMKFLQQQSHVIIY